MIRLGGPIFKPDELDPAKLVKHHQRFGYSAAFCNYIADANEREEFKHAFKEADIVLAELGAYCINISDPNKAHQEKNIIEIMTRLREAEEMEAICCVMHGGSYNNKGCVMSHMDNFSEANIEHNIRVIQRIIDEVQPRKTKLVLETGSYVLPDNPDVFLQMLKGINREAFAVHLDPVNMISTPRRVYYSGDFLRECFAKLGQYIVSCHAKDTNIIHHFTTQITETYVGNGTVDYDVYLSELNKLAHQPPLMIEHLSEQELPIALDYLFGKSKKLGLTFKYEEKRELIGRPSH